MPDLLLQGPPAPGDNKAGRPYHVVHPLSAEVRLGVNGKGEVTGGAPRVSCEMTVGAAVRVCLDCATMRCAASSLRSSPRSSRCPRLLLTRRAAGRQGHRERG